MDQTGESRQSASRFVRSRAVAVNVTTQAPPQARSHVLDPRYYDENNVWCPLRRDGLWLERKDWKRNLVGLRRAKDGVAALAALKSVFIPEWSARQSGVQNLHQVVYDALTVGGRHRLIEVGAMLSSMSTIPKRLRSRLLLRGEYPGVCSELLMAMLLRATGADFQFEPLKSGSGPDGIARWPEGALAIEVKRPNESARSLATQRIELDFFSEFQLAVASSPLLVDTGVWITLHVDTRQWPTTATGAPDLERICALAREVAAIVRDRLVLPTASLYFAAAPGVDVDVQIGLSDEPSVQLGMLSRSADFEHSGQRIFQILQDAGHQLRRVPELPGLVVFDGDADLGILNHVAEIAEMLKEDWARDLAGVAIVTKTATADERSKELRLDTVVRIVNGSRADALADTLLKRLRVCERRHYHVDPLLRPTRRCGAW